MQISQKELEHMAQLQKERAKTNRETIDNNFVNQETEQFSNEEINEVRINKPGIPSFPLFLFAFAILKDILDLAELTIIGIIISWFVTAIFVVIVWFWCLGKVGSIKKIVIRRLLMVAALSLIPIIGLFPEASLFILWVHFREVRYIGDILQALEKMEV